MEYTRREVFAIAVVGFLNFSVNVCAYLQAPFYPAEAAEKGATATEYGIVFGSFQCARLILGPIFGNYIRRIGVKRAISFGMVIYSVSCIAFGFLEYVYDTLTFVSISFLLRVVEGVGSSLAVVGAFTMLMSLFPEKVASVFAIAEICYGSGMVFGPFIGSMLYALGGFILPFLSVGIASLIAGFFAFLLIPTEAEHASEPEENVSMKNLFTSRTICLKAALLVVVSVADSFYTTLLETHLTKFGVSVVDVGLIFAIAGAAYAISSYLYSKIIERWSIYDQMDVFGCVMELISFTLVGPAPYFPFAGSVPLAIVGMIIHGIGSAAIYISTFTGISKLALEIGYPSSVTTYGVVSGFWLSSYYLGSFVGPIVAGILYDQTNFSTSSLMIIALYIVSLIAIWIFYAGKPKKSIYSILGESHSITKMYNGEGHKYGTS